MSSSAWRWLREKSKDHLQLQDAKASTMLSQQLEVAASQDRLALLDTESQELFVRQTRKLTDQHLRQLDS